MKKRSMMIIALTLALALIFATVASALDADMAEESLTDEEAIARGVEWELLNDLYYRAQGVLERVGDSFTDYYTNTLKGTSAAAKQLLDSPTSSIVSLREMDDDLSYLLDEQYNPANHSRPGYYTVAFTNNGKWSEPVYMYCWNDNGDPDSFPWPGQTMMSGYVNEYGQRQYYAYVREDCANILFVSGSIEAEQGSAAPCVEVQTEDIRVTGNTGYYLTGKRDSQAHYTVKSWQLKQPVYKQYYVIQEPDQPTEAQTEKPTEAPAELPTQYNVDDYLPYDGSMLELYQEPFGSELRQELYYLIVDATGTIAPGNEIGDALREKIMRVRNFAVRVHNYRESMDHELTGALEMLRAAMDDRSYDEIIGIGNHYFITVDGDEPTQPAQEPTGHEGGYTGDDYIIGDADGDGEVSVLDATRIQRVLADYQVEDSAGVRRRGDVTGNGLDILDATSIQRHLAGLPSNERIGARIQ